MKIINLKLDKYKTEMDIDIRNQVVGREHFSDEYEIDGLVKFQMKMTIHSTSDDAARNVQNSIFSNPSQPSSFGFGSSYSNTVNVLNNVTNKWTIGLSAKFINIKNDFSIYALLSSKTLDIQNMCINADSTWHWIIGKSVTNPIFNFSFTIDTQSNKLKLLHDDEELTDFELRGDDGSVKVHKCILATVTPVFQSMLQGDWKETRNGYIHLEGMPKTALQDFKRYIYLNTLPPTVSEHVLIIAMRYQITDLEMACTKTMIEGLNAENVCDLLDFAVAHKCDRLKIAILECVQNGSIKVDEIKI